MASVKFKYQRRLTNFKRGSDAAIFPASDMSSSTFSQDRWNSEIKVAGAGIGLTNSVYRRIKVLARMITAASAHQARFRGDSVPGKLCSCRLVLGSAGGFEVLTGQIVALWVASGHEYGSTREDVNVGGVYALPWIISHRAAGVGQTGAAPCDLEVMKTCTIETRLFTCHISIVRMR